MFTLNNPPPDKPPEQMTDKEFAEWIRRNNVYFLEHQHAAWVNTIRQRYPNRNAVVYIYAGAWAIADLLILWMCNACRSYELDNHTEQLWESVSAIVMRMFRTGTRKHLWN